MKLALTFEDNGRGHDDLLLELGDASWRCDSYYFAIDRSHDPDVVDAAKTRRVLRAVLQGWLTALSELAPRGTIYLAWDFSDEYTRWLECVRQDEAVEVFVGHSSVAGWSFYPSQVADHLARPAGYVRELGPVQSTARELRSLLEALLR